MRYILTAAACILLASSWTSPAGAHSKDRVRSELRDQGYDQIEIKGSKAPFMVDACRDGERFHLHVDWYGKVTEVSNNGSCDEDVTDAPADDSQSSMRESVGKTDCRRYIPAVGKTISVPCIDE